MKNILRILASLAGIILACIFVATISRYKIAEYKKEVAMNDMYVHPTVDHISEELDCMAMNIYKEAANEAFEGKVAVAQVTMNRVGYKDFPDTVCEVVHEKNVFMKKVICQFSWYCSNRNKGRVLNQVAYDESYKVAQKVMIENFRLDSVKDAMYFHSDDIKPNWKYKQVAKIGGHIFYKDRS